jgi:hypothetical protein
MHPTVFANFASKTSSAARDAVWLGVGPRTISSIWRGLSSFTFSGSRKYGATPNRPCRNATPCSLPPNGWLTLIAEEELEVRRKGNQGGHCEQHVGNSIDQHNAERGHGEERKA